MTSQELEIKRQIRERFASVARWPESETVFLVGPDSAKQLGYDADEIDNLPTLSETRSRILVRLRQHDYIQAFSPHRLAVTDGTITPAYFRRNDTSLRR